MTIGNSFIQTIEEVAIAGSASCLGEYDRTSGCSSCCGITKMIKYTAERGIAI